MDFIFGSRHVVISKTVFLIMHSLYLSHRVSIPRAFVCYQSSDWDQNEKLLLSSNWSSSFICVWRLSRRQDERLDYISLLFLIATFGSRWVITNCFLSPIRQRLAKIKNQSIVWRELLTVHFSTCSKEHILIYCRLRFTSKVSVFLPWTRISTIVRKKFALLARNYKELCLRYTFAYESIIINKKT